MAYTFIPDTGLSMADKEQLIQIQIGEAATILSEYASKLEPTRTIEDLYLESCSLVRAIYEKSERMIDIFVTAERLTKMRSNP
jgi:hypothetical protein